MEASVAAEPWQRTLYVVLAAPSAIIALADGGRLQNWSGRRLLGHPIRTTRVRGLLTLPLALLTLVIVGYGWSIVVLNVAYPIRPLLGMPGYDRNAWGGPTYAGVWAVHVAGGGGSDRPCTCSRSCEGAGAADRPGSDDNDVTGAGSGCRQPPRS